MSAIILRIEASPLPRIESLYYIGVLIYVCKNVTGVLNKNISRLGRNGGGKILRKKIETIMYNINNDLIPYTFNATFVSNSRSYVM